MSEIQRPVVSYLILESIKTDTGTLYSTLLNNEFLIGRYPDVSEFVKDVHKLIALDMIKLESEWSPEDGDDIRFFLTERGIYALKTLHE